MYTTASMT